MTNTIADAYGQLRRAQKSAGGVSPYLRYVNRPLGRLAAAVAARFGWTPNLVTAASAVLSVAGLAAIATVQTTPALAAIAATALFAGYVLDSADGQLARLTGTGGPAGEWVDHVVDGGRHVGLHLAVAIALSRFWNAESPALLMPLAFALVSGTRFFALNLAEQLQRGARSTPRPVPAAGWRSAIQLPADSGLLNFVFLLLPWPRVFLTAYGCLLAANTLLLVMSLRRRYVELAQLGSGEAR
ncbi:CDP-alcohol phosphatidyltransferase family protein [Kribbella sp. NBC_01245]|uniref:CDP-alcohol phosphatidyltransferase family protein n=1 Tax=Kribbella sp. NBC_01245 TaxID=2903578 RepID=UPI002E2927BF|nr:CDP-alcohol phosphatidyltransferase family protein [Kribbella sp. NBC_01245]